MLPFFVGLIEVNYSPVDIITSAPENPIWEPRSAP